MGWPSPFCSAPIHLKSNLQTYTGDSERLELWAKKTRPTKAVFLVTHNIEEAVPLADRIVQPVAQIMASVPATAFFPILLMGLVRIGAATDSGRFAMLLLATIFISLMVVTMNRLVRRKLYRLAETRFKLEG
jgi:ABC-type anion transport system duplicated permease subunit